MGLSIIDPMSKMLPVVTLEPPGENQTLAVGTKEEGESTQPGLAANGRENPLYEKRSKCLR
jgi:hypothetical protein